MIRPDLQHRSLMGRVQAQQCQRNTDIVVKARFAPEGIEFLTQNAGQQFFGRGLAIRAADYRDRQGKLVAVSGGHSSEGQPGIFYGEGGDRHWPGLGGRDFVAFDQHSGHAPLHGSIEKRMAVKPIARKRDK
jgi:hypothetical protein